MMLRKYTLPLTVCATLILLGLGPAEKAFEAKAFQSQSREEREAIAETIRQDRAKIIQDLISVAAAKVKAPSSDGQGFPEDSVWHEPKHLAIQILGDLRATESVSVLMNNLGYYNPESTHMPRLELRYSGFAFPAAKSLSLIGMPAVQPLLARLSILQETATERRICLWTLKEILGERLAKVRLEMALEETKDDTARANLKAAMVQLQSDK